MVPRCSYQVFSSPRRIRMGISCFIPGEMPLLLPVPRCPKEDTILMALFARKPLMRVVWTLRNG